MNRIFFLVGTGGFLGSISRYYSQLLVSKYFPGLFPFGTLAINTLGCFLIGAIYGLSIRGGELTPEWRLFLATGFCGGFTTFSAFSLESMVLIKGGEFLMVATYVAASVLLGFLATYLGIWLMKFI